MFLLKVLTTIIKDNMKNENKSARNQKGKKNREKGGKNKNNFPPSSQIESFIASSPPLY